MLWQTLSIRPGQAWSQMPSYGEKQRITGSAQEGFRRYHNTSRQLEMAILMIEDAALYNQDIYSPYVDFSSAFNTVNHKQLILIMQTLGYPNTAIKAAESIYTNACTRILTPHEETGVIQIGRGTLQGDTSSPYLFLFFIEPLLRWLQHV